MQSSAFVLGFHGCDESVGEKVLAGKSPLHPSQNDYDWLGHGIYFWENSAKRALDWAQFIHKKPGLFKTKIAKPFVVGAIIDLGRCLDLTEARSLEIVKAGYSDMKAFFDALRDMVDDSFEMPKNAPGHPGDEDLLKRNLDCAVINWVHTSREERKEPPFDSVRGAFPEGPPLYDGAGIRARTHIQISVRSPRSIRGYFRVLPNQFE